MSAADFQHQGRGPAIGGVGFPHQLVRMGGYRLEYFAVLANEFAASAAQKA